MSDRRSFVTRVASIAAGIALLATAPFALSAPKAALVERVAMALENRSKCHSGPSEQPPTGLIVLGGSSDRALAALNLARRYQHARVILSGPGPVEEQMLSTAPELQGRLTIDHRPRNTFENALFSAELAKSGPGDRWFVVTSALHVSRSMGAFRVVGFKVECWPVQDTPTKPDLMAPAVRHEVLGLVYYWLRGRYAIS